jgi:GAF domain-containing protein
LVVDRYNPAMRKNPTRLALLKQLLVLDSSPEKAFDDLTGMLATCLDVPITMVNFLDEERDWFKSCVGLAQRQGPVETSFCEQFFHTTDDIFVVEDTLNSPRLADHGLVTGPPHIRFYAAARLAIAGQTVGTLCAYDTRPRSVSPEQIEQLRILALAVLQLLRERHA